MSPENMPKKSSDHTVLPAQQFGCCNGDLDRISSCHSFPKPRVPDIYPSLLLKLHH